MKKLALVTMAIASLAIVPACTVDSPESEPSDEDVAEGQSALIVNGSGWASVFASGALNASFSYNSSVLERERRPHQRRHHPVRSDHLLPRHPRPLLSAPRLPR